MKTLAIIVYGFCLSTFLSQVVGLKGLQFLAACVFFGALSGVASGALEELVEKIKR